jgi:adenosylcobinamide-phosphate synthase
LLYRTGGASLKTARTDGLRHKSPNAGYPEAAFAGALGVRLGGPNMYHGLLVEKPWIGAGYGDVTAGHIIRGCHLMMLTGLLWSGGVMLCKMLMI